ncbi:MAG TPA: hypothetical protein VF701_21890 [Thermoanaerobaculia bacterium]
MPNVTIAFLGQCHTTGYDGVPPQSTFLEVARRAIAARRPEVTIDYVIESVPHPADFAGALGTALRSNPSVVVLEIVGWLAVTGARSVDLSRLPPHVRGAYARLRHFRTVARQMVAGFPIVANLVDQVNVTAAQVARSPLGDILPRLPRATIEEYEQLVNEALAPLTERPGISVVIQGPGEMNQSLSWNTSPDVIERYRQVDAMARRIAEKHAALFIDRWASTTSAFYQPGGVRPSIEGHMIWGHLLADELLDAGLV